MNTETLCEICSHLISSPTILKCCYSSVCFDCLKRISKKDKKNLDKFSYKCPFCNKEQQGYTGIKSNMFLARYIEFCYKKGKLKTVECGKCHSIIKSTEANFCNSCQNKFLCKECDTQVHGTENAKNHESLNVNSLLKTYAGSLNKSMMCHLHIKEKIESICLKDLTTLCKTCVTYHKRGCKENKIVPLEKAHIELASQLSEKLGQVNNCRNMIDEEYTNIKQKLEDFNKSVDKIMHSIDIQFKELREIINLKEKEAKSFIEQLSIQRKSALNQEIQTLEKLNSKTESLIGIVEFAMSYPTSFFCEGAGYLMQRLNRLNESFPKAEPTKLINIPDLELNNINNCKAALRCISLQEALPAPKCKDFFQRSKSEALSEDPSTKIETMRSSLLSPRLENYSIIEEAKKKNLRMKIKSISTPSKIKPPNISKVETAHESLSPSPQRHPAPIKMKSFSYKNLIARLYSPKDQKSTLKTDSSIQTNQLKETAITSNLSARNSRISKSPQFKPSSLKSFADSPKQRRSHTEEASSYLSPEFKEEDSLTEEDHRIMDEIRKNPLMKRKFYKISQTANSIFVKWLHPIEKNNITYQLDYGVGSKVQNVEQFRTAFKGTAGCYAISGLMPRTKYRLRVCPVLPREHNTECDSNSLLKNSAREIYGIWSDTVTIVTKDLQTIDLSSVGNYAVVNSQGRETIVDFAKSGKVVAKNEYEYGRTSWEIRIPQQNAHQCPLDSNSSIKVGVTNKNGKIYNVVGSLINYGLNTEAMVIKVFLDVDSRSMTVYNSNSKSKEIINNLPDGALYPAFQNKTNKDSNFPLKLIIIFDLPCITNEIKDFE